jgi:hypothetical protein
LRRVEVDLALLAVAAVGRKMEWRGNEMENAGKTNERK